MTERLEDFYEDDLYAEAGPDGDCWVVIGRSRDAVVIDDDQARNLRDWLTAWLERQ